MDKSPAFTGTQVNYFVICPRKLWLFTKGLSMEHTSEAVAIGRLLHESAYAREQKEILIDNRIQIDFSSSPPLIHEVKKSKKMEDAHRLQLLYYLYYLKTEKDLTDLKGQLHYPKLRRTEEIELTPEDERRLQEILSQIEEVLKRPTPPPRLEKMAICKKCSYYEMCYT
jgi:CRISPR-associated exonuclease Cas4